MSETGTRSDRKRAKELKVLELHLLGFAYRKIAREVHVSLRDVTNYVQKISSKKKSQSMTSIHDEIILEYRVNLLRTEVRDLKIRRDKLMSEVNDLRTQKFKLQIQVCAKQSELEFVKRNLEYEKFSKEILNDIFTDGH